MKKIANYSQRKKMILSILCFIFSIFYLTAQEQTPNLIIIQTDEHNFRTLGCYRDLLSEDQAFMWGPDAVVETPYIDSLAENGALCTSFYATSPVCTPSRASFVSGLYPYATGAETNDLPLKDEVVTFAQVLKEKGYATSYVGKWHLEGRSDEDHIKDKKTRICFIPERKFGFSDNRYMINNGHPPYIKELKDGKLKFLSRVKPNEAGEMPKDTYYVTDYLTDRSLEILERDKNQPFCLMLSIPDPHTPNVAREPYVSMFKDMQFTVPKTMTTDVKRPDFGAPKNKNEAKEFDQDYMRGYFGMVKCIDDNVGRILSFLKDNNLEENTIVVFTSDHGDMLFEHKRRNKSVPYEAAAKIPFVIKYPGKIKSGKVINKAYTTADFTPTILSLMDAPSIPNVHGLDDSDLFENDNLLEDSDRITYTRTPGGWWVTAISDNYKLVVSKKEEPWLYDLKNDPNELYNVYNKKDYKEITSSMVSELKRQLKLYKDPAFSKGTEYQF